MMYSCNVKPAESKFREETTHEFKCSSASANGTLEHDDLNSIYNFLTYTVNEKVYFIFFFYG